MEINVVTLSGNGIKTFIKKNFFLIFKYTHKTFSSRGDKYIEQLTL